MANWKIILDAVRNRRQIIGIYRGHRRAMCPHVLGRKGRKILALFYQFDGSCGGGLCKAGSRRNWRLIPVDELNRVQASDGPWHTAAGDFPKLPDFDEVIAAVS